MKTIIVTGSSGLVGSECVRYFAAREFRVFGIDNDMRAEFFGPEASTEDTDMKLRDTYGNFNSFGQDIRNLHGVDRIFSHYAGEICAVIHTAAQPSHDWAASDPVTDFGINAVGTLNLLLSARKHCPEAPFVFTSTNKVYGDGPNSGHGLEEDESRYDPCVRTAYDGGFDYRLSSTGMFGFDETLSIDRCTHSLFGASKLAADILVQEYGRYFGMPTVSFRCGCITGAAHAGAKQHGFLSYLVRCAMTDTPYEIIGYKGKQVRDNIHAADLVTAFDRFIQRPRPGEVYNLGGGRENSCSVREAISLVERISGRKLRTSYTDTPRIGDHQWWITDNRKFQRDYPGWKVTRGLGQIIQEMVDGYAGPPADRS